MAERTSLLSDDELLAALAASFPVEPVEPDAALLHQLSMAVAELRLATPATAHSPAPATRRPRWTLPRRLSPLVLASAVVGVVGAGTGISYAVGVPIPTAVRSIARTVGLADPTTPTAPRAASAPAPTPAVSAARHAESTLHEALTQSHPSPSVITHDSAVLAHRLAQVGGHPVGGTAGGTAADGQHLLHEACRQLEGSGSVGAGSVDAGSVGATFPGCAPVGVGHSPTGPPGTSSTAPRTTTPTTEAPSPSHPGPDTSGGPVRAPVGGSPGTPSDGTRTGGATGTTPGTPPDHSPEGSSGDRSGHSSSPSAGSTSHTQSHGTPATNPRSGASSR